MSGGSSPSRRHYPHGQGRSSPRRAAVDRLKFMMAVGWVLICESVCRHQQRAFEGAERGLGVLVGGVAEGCRDGGETRGRARACIFCMVLSDST